MTDPPDALPPEQGGGPPSTLMPWTLVVEEEDWSADLEHGAPVPRAGDVIEHIADDGDKRLFRVVRVVHTVQSSSSDRPLVRDEREGPNSTVAGRVDTAPHSLRAGLPRVIVVPLDA
jgi:hypothetical protein